MSSFVRVNWKDDYFFEELLYTNEDHLKDAKEIEIKVETLNYGLKYRGNNPLRMDNNAEKESHKEDDQFERISKNERPRNCQCQDTNILNKDQSLILDIDLDFFSTHNPFKRNHSEVSI